MLPVLLHHSGRLERELDLQQSGRNSEQQEGQKEKTEGSRRRSSANGEEVIQEIALNDDIRKIRDQIDSISKEYLEAQKRFDKAEKEYLEAKVELFIRAEEKDKLTETLKTIILKNEIEKGQKLSPVGKLEIKSKVVASEERKKS